MSKLRQKMVREMELREFSVNTQKAYLAAVEGLVKFYRRSPDKIVRQEIENYLLYLKNKIDMRIRHYGFLANRCKDDNLKKCYTFRT